jgi:hypothetical protein
MSKVTELATAQLTPSPHNTVTASSGERPTAVTFGDFGSRTRPHQAGRLGQKVIDGHFTHEFALR